MSKIRSHKIIPNKISLAFLVPGVLTLILSTIYESQALALVGLGLTFWGALFFLVRPFRFVEGDLLSSTALPIYSTIDRIIRDFNYAGAGHYIPPYPENAYIPDHLKGLKDIVVFVSAENKAEMPSIEEMSKGKFLTEKPKGLLVAPPGSGLLAHIEKKMKVNLTQMTLDELLEVLPSYFTENLNLALSMEFTFEQNEIYLQIVDSLYKSLYLDESKKMSVNILGCPIVSAVACALAKASGKTIVIEKQKASPDGLIIEIWYRII